MMDLHSDIIAAILNTWDAPTYDGSQDARQWLRAIEELCQRYNIPPTQRTEMAVKCTAGQANLVLTAMLKAKVDKAGVWSWADFKACVILIEDNMRNAAQGVGDGGSNSQYLETAAALILVGAGLTLPAVWPAILGAIGFGTGGVVAGSLAAAIQSAIYGGPTGGLFSVFQSLGATVVAPPLFQTLAGVGTTAAGAWVGYSGATREGREDREDHPAEES